jgi:hypothetical protein
MLRWKKNHHLYHYKQKGKTEKVGGDFDAGSCGIVWKQSSDGQDLL